MAGSFWSFAENLNLWGDISVQRQLDSARRNRPIFQRLQQDLAALGFNRTWQQCRVKIKNLTATYRKLRDSNRRSDRGILRVVSYAYSVASYVPSSLHPPPEKKIDTVEHAHVP